MMHTSHGRLCINWHSRKDIQSILDREMFCFQIALAISAEYYLLSSSLQPRTNEHWILPPRCLNSQFTTNVFQNCVPHILCHARYNLTLFTSISIDDHCLPRFFFLSVGSQIKSRNPSINWRFSGITIMIQRIFPIRISKQRMDCKQTSRRSHLSEVVKDLRRIHMVKHKKGIVWNGSRWVAASYCMDVCKKWECCL